MAIWDIKERYKKARGNEIRGDIGFAFGSETAAIDKVQISTTGNATDFGDLLDNCQGGGGAGNTVRYLHGGGQQTTTSNQIEYGTFASAGNAADFGDLTDARQILSAVSNNVRCVWGGGRENPGSGYNTRNIMDSVFFSSLGNAVDFGDLTVARLGVGSMFNNIRGIFAGGQPATDVMDYITIATAGNATDFGNLFEAEDYFAGVSSSTRGSVAGGGDATIQTIQFATLGNATDYGDTSVDRLTMGSASNSLRGVFFGGQQRASPGASLDVIDYIAIATGGTAVDFGDLTLATGQKNSGTSNGHGGIDLDFVQRPSATYMPGSGRMLHAAGQAPGDTQSIGIFHIPTLGNEFDFGDLSAAQMNSSATSSLTRSIFQGGNPATATMNYIEFASGGNTADFGDQAAQRFGSGLSSSTRGVMAGGNNPGVSNVMEYITMASVGNSTDFGDTTDARYSMATTASSTRGVMGGGISPGYVNIIDYWH